MPSLNIHVTLSEVLEVRDGPLSEREMWAVICQATEALQDHFLKGEASHDEGPSFAVTPDTILLNGQGYIQFTESSFDSVRNKDYVPPEWNPRRYFSDEQIEKIYVFALGVSIYNAADHNLGKDEALDISDDLDNLLGAMCEDDCTARINFMGVLEAFEQNARLHPRKQSNRGTIQNLYKLVLGSATKLDGWPESDDREYEHLQERSRKKTAASRGRSRSESGSRQRSRSRSKPRSRSRSADRSSRFSARQERPVPLGRDHTPEHREAYRKYPPFSPVPFHAYPPYHPAAPYPPYDPYMPAPVALHPGRRVVGEEYRGMYGPPQWRGVSPRLPLYERAQTPPAVMADPEMRKTYERIKERQQKLSILRRGMEVDEYSDSTSLGSEATDFGDRRSIISANSYTQGVYRPDLLLPYGPDRALRLGREGDFDPDESLHSDAAWIRKQEDEIQAMQKALEEFIEKSGSQTDSRSRSRQRSRTPGPSQPMERPASRQRASSEPRSRSKSRDGRKAPNRQPRKFYGPEFLHTDRVTSVHVPQARSSHQKDVRHVFVHLLSGDKLDVVCEHCTLGRELFDAVVAHLGLPEHYLFGLTFVQEAESFFIDPDQKLSKVAPSNWKDPGKHREAPPFTTYFRVKFYVENAAVLKHPTTKHLFYLQLRRDLLEDKVQCTEEQAMSMAGLAMQAEYGDWYEKCRDFIPEVYLPPKVMKSVGKSYARDNVPLEHRKHFGMPDNVAELKFIKLAQQLDDYGIHYYKVYRHKKDTKSASPIWTGISVRGIQTAEQSGAARAVTRRHPWQMTQKISFNRRRFSIKPKPEVGVGKVAKLDYYTDSYKKGRYLLKLATAHHRFLLTMHMRIEPNIEQIIEQEYPWEAGASDYEEEDDVGDDVTRYDDDGLVADDVINDVTMHNDSFEDYTDTEQDRGSHYGTPARPGSRLSSRENLSRSHTPQSRGHARSRSPSRSPHRSPHNSRPPSRTGTPKARVVGVSIRSHDSDFLPLSTGTLTDTLKDRFDNMASPTGAQERRIVVVELVKEPDYGIGLTIVGGENTGKLDLGVFVKDILPGGPAERSGQVHSGDRIIAINGQSLEGMPHQGAVELIRESHSKVQLLLSQPVGGFPGDILDTASETSAHDYPGVAVGGEESPHVASPAPFSKPARTKRPNQASRESLNASLSSLGRSPAHIQRSDSIDSSDLDIENVIPPEAMSPLTIGSSKSPARDVMAQLRAHSPGVATGAFAAADSRGQGQGHSQAEDASEINSVSDDDISANQSSRSSKRGPEAEVADEASGRSSRQSERYTDYEKLKPGEEYELILRKVNNSLGLNVAGGVNTTVKDGGIYVKSFAEGGSAERDGRIRVGDRVLSINGVSLVGVTHKQAVETLRSAPLTSRLLLVRGVPPAPQRPVTPADPTPTPMTSPSVMDSRVVSPSLKSDTDLPSDTDLKSDTDSKPEMTSAREEEDDEEDFYSFVNSDNVFELTLRVNTELENASRDGHQSGNTYAVDIPRSSNGLGFSILGGVDQHSDPAHCVVRVKRVFPHGPAHDAGLQEGDVILQVNNVTLGNLANKEVLQILRTTQAEARMLICRPGPGVLPPISQVKQDLDSTLDSQASVPMATSTPSADQMLGDAMSPYSPTEDLEHLAQGPSLHKDHMTLGQNLHRPLDRSPSQRIELDPPSESDYSECEEHSEESELSTTRNKTLTPGAERSGPGESPLPAQQTQSQEGADSHHTATAGTGEPTAATEQPAAVSDQSTAALGRMTPTGERTVQTHGSDDNGDDEGENEAGNDVDEDSLNTAATTTTNSRRRTPSPVKTFLHDAGLTSGEPTPAPTPAATPSVERAASEAASGSRAGVSDERTDDGSDDDDDDDATERDVAPHEYEVTLTKGDKGLGFTVAGGQHMIGVFYVKDVLYNPALSDGTIQRGDRLIGVNGEDMTKKSHKEAVDYLRQTPQVVTLRFVRHDDWESSEATSYSPTPRQQRVIDARQKSDDSLRKNAQTVIDSLNTSRSDVTDLSTRSQAATSDRTATPTNTIESTDDASDDDDGGDSKNDRAASGGARKSPSQRVLKPPEVEIHEASGEVEGSGSESDTPTLGKEENKLSVSGDDADDAEVPSVASSFGNITLPMSDLEERATPVNRQSAQRAEKPQSGVIRIELTKSPEGGLGFTLVQGEKGLSSALFVRSIAPGGAAETDGRLRVGDKLLQVNGESVIGMPHNKAVALVKKSQGRVQIAVSRGPSRPPSTGPTQGATPSRELEEQATQDNHSDTDSDVDSATLDDDVGDGRSSPGWPMSGRTSAKTVETEASNDEIEDTFDEEGSAYNAFLENKSGVKREQVMRPASPEKPARSTRFTRVPERITDEYLATLDLVKPPQDTVHYTGRQLQITCKALKVKVERDDPVEEYKSLKHAKLTDNCIEARKPENKVKNRFRNVIPYDATRVVLGGLDDYINASHIRIQVGKASLHYIATQGPMPETTGDFWRMIWEQKVEVIAMVTQEMEGGKVKCHRYWPDTPNVPLTLFGRYEVSLTRVEQLANFDIQHLKMKDLQEQVSHSVTHLNFKTWPDTGAPESGVPLLQYIRLMHLLHDSGPLVVHCSVGIGRTGALITIDTVLNLIARDLKFDIQKIVQDLRRQRQGMIQTKDQYRFCYKTVIEALDSINTSAVWSTKSMGETF